MHFRNGDGCVVVKCILEMATVNCILEVATTSGRATYGPRKTTAAVQVARTPTGGTGDRQCQAPAPRAALTGWSESAGIRMYAVSWDRPRLGITVIGMTCCVLFHFASSFAGVVDFKVQVLLWFKAVF